MKTRLILSSTSPARRLLLARLQIPFETIAPEVNESVLPQETPRQLVKRLAKAKALIHAPRYKRSLIIGCDQVALLNNEIVSKPLSHEKAVEQLQHSSGKIIQFFTGVSLYNTVTRKMQFAIEFSTVTYRILTQELIEHYLLKERPYHCAGSLQVEGLGIALLERIITKDPTALIGLPLIRLVKMLSNEGLFVP